MRFTLLHLITALVFLALPAQAVDLGLGPSPVAGSATVDSTAITDGSIVNADVNASAAIVDTKLATIATAGKVSDSALSSNIPLKNAANTFSAAQVVNIGNSENMLTLGNSTNGWGTLRILTGATHPGWIVSAQNNVTNALEISASTANGGTTFTTPILTVASNGNVTAGTGNYVIATLGSSVRYKEGSNAAMGSSALVGGSVVVATTAATATARIQVTSNADGGTPGWLRVSTRTAGTSFTITSSSGTDTSTVAWIIFEPSP